MNDDELEGQATGAGQQAPAGTGTGQPPAAGEQAPKVTPEAPVSPLAQFDISGLPPEQQAYLKSVETALQSDYTKKTQAVAEQRRALESEGQAPAWAGELEEIARQDPATAAARLRATADQLEGGGGGYQPPAPAAGAPPMGAPLPSWDEMTETERFLAASLVGMQQQMQQVQQQTLGQVRTVTEQAEDRALEAELTRVRTTYPGVPETEILEVLAHHDMPVDDAIWLTPTGRKLFLESALAAGGRTTGEKQAASIGPGAAGSGGAAVPAMSMDEAWERAGRT